MDRMSLSDRLLPALFGPTNTTRFPGSSDVPSLNLILVILYRYFSVCVATGMFRRLPSCLPRAACYFPSNTIPPIPWLALPVSHGKDYDLRREILVNDAEGKLPEGVFSEIGDVDWPTLRRFPAIRMTGAPWKSSCAEPTSSPSIFPRHPKPPASSPRSC